VHSVRQWPNLRHLGELLGGDEGVEGLLEALSFKKATKGMGRGKRRYIYSNGQSQAMGIHIGWVRLFWVG